jgi:hypothetical protein
VSNDLATALQSLPHGPEFRFVDRLTQLQPGHHASGEPCAVMSHFFAATFPDNP